MTPVVVIGKGRIGAPVADWIHRSATCELLRVVGRGEAVPPAPLAIDAAGPHALREHGERLLTQGDLWTVGAAALIDDALRERLMAAARAHGHELRLFTGWIAGPALCPSHIAGTLFIHQCAPGLSATPGLLFEGPLRQAAAQYPDHLNTATAAALAGPGLEATHIALHCSPPGGAHAIRARFEVEGQTIDSEVRFGEGPHPVALAIIAALERRGTGLRYG